MACLRVCCRVSVILFLPHILYGLSGYCFHPWRPDGWAGGRKIGPDCISETVRCRKLMLGRDIG